MDVPNAIKWSLVYRAVATGSLLAGVALVAFGFVSGFWGSLNLLISDPLNPGSAIDAANPMVTVALSIVGIAVWQFGKTVALFYTLPRAAGRQAAKQFDRQALKSDILQGLDGRLSDLEEDVAETRRAVQEIKREQHAASFDEREALEGEDPPALESASSTGGAAGRRPLDDIDRSSDERSTSSGEQRTNRSSPQSSGHADAETGRDENDPVSR
ncbi:hypothetical protein OB919_01245 [Halobacteria archaeon AArc-curdl1]|uniref:Uncharacterized protein n=1 Tax=Natronosalvus hydrolyticus TaxID=2979988 RepID=A0AAP2Z4K6_9EURY|nr:hypothetical protein [Halobacteria archaeon AArc-curdl1]